MKPFILSLLLIGCTLLRAEEDECTRLWRDLEVVAEIDKNLLDELPLVYNSQMQIGYFTMPSARMAKTGVMGFGFCQLPPYQVYSLLFQLFDRLEVTGNYWIYRGRLAGGFGHLGFGDDAERAGNLKFSLLRKGDGIPELPEFAIGMNDIIGTRRFRSFYAVATQSFLRYNLELTLGWGAGRIQGFFAGAAWTPLRKAKNPLKNLTFIFEYDANNYRKHSSEHPEGRSVKSRFNAGLQFSVGKYIHASVSSLRGEKLAASASITYPLGDTEGFLPKIHDACPYTAPIDTQALGELRSEEEFAQELAYAFQTQGIDLYTAMLEPKAGGANHLWLKVINVRYREEDVMRKRIEAVLASLIPSNVEGVSVVVEADGIKVHEYRFRSVDLQRYQDKKLSGYELRVIAPLKEASSKPGEYDASLLYQRKKSIWVFTARPLFQPYFGTATGKFKYDVGFLAGPEGYLFDEIYYNLVVSYVIKSSAYNVGSWDRLNPSQIINVRSDSIRYHQSNTFHVDELYVQKSWNLGEGWFTRAALGYFETAYAGLAWEALYYPVSSNWAIGVEAAMVMKRKYSGMGLTRQIRLLQGTTPTYVHFLGLQYFLDVYYQFKPLQLDFKFSLGQFLAKDKGIRMEGGRTFSSGLRVALWWAFTNANDVVNNSRYFDKGFSVTMPLDWFMMKSSRTRIGYSMSAWLRDIAAKSYTGKELYETIYYERWNSKQNFY